MTMKKLVAVVAMSGAMMFGLASTAQSAPRVPNVEGMTQSQAEKVLKSAGVDVTVFSQGNRLSTCKVVGQQSLNNRYDVKWVKNKETGKREFVRVPAPKAVLKVKCSKNF